MKSKQMEEIKKEFEEKLANIFGYVEELSPYQVKEIYKRLEYVETLKLFESLLSSQEKRLIGEMREKIEKMTNDGKVAGFSMVYKYRVLSLLDSSAKGK
jgi:hypothetical protein